jgi:putative restriction endonuclease
MPKNNWSREELILAFNLYCKVTFTKINASNKDIKAFALLIGRSNSAVALKLANFARLDPELQKRGVSGMEHGSKGEETIWKEFNNNWDQLAYESETLLAKYEGVPIEEIADNEEVYVPKLGLDKEALVKIRINQKFFRKTVLASYENKCCITGIRIPQLLNASHIIPWSKDTENRVNPHNGLCLNALHDRAFDKGLITVTPDFKIKVSPILLNSKSSETLNFITHFHDQAIIKPTRFVPVNEFLEYHNNNIFKTS